MTVQTNEYVRVNMTEEEADSLIAFIKKHEREDIPDDVWDICMVLMEETNRL